MSTVLAIDDDALTLKCYQFALAELDIELFTATTAEQGVKLFQERRPEVVLCDLRLPDGTGLDVFRRLKLLDVKTPFILATGYGTAGTAIEAMGLGVYDYLVKPIDPDQLNELVERALETSRLMRVPAVVAPTAEEPEGAEAAPAGDVLIGRSPAMQEVYKAIGRVAPQDVTVLILGESGTGKEMVARAIYHYSRRSTGPFLALNCAAFPETLLESELFGHERGAFTGADRKRVGKFEQANGGTLFLDEIGDMSPLMQTKLLRVLQDLTFERVGGSETIRTNVRVIAATNRDLEKAVERGEFRADLFYRLNVFTIRLPALRERLGDLPLLVQHFVRRYARELKIPVETVAGEALALLERYPWPGNVRELQSTLKQSLLRVKGPLLQPQHLPEKVRGEERLAESPAFDDTLPEFVRRRLREGTANLHEEVLEQVERVVFREVLRHTVGNQSQAATLLGISRPTLRAKVQKLRLAIDRVTPGEGAHAPG
jgi:two-component system nitrogen regulation response regulator GlnG